MLQSREILTLQFGNYSNFVGTHWWNVQVRTLVVSMTNQLNKWNLFLKESGFSYDPNATPSDVDHDLLYREGVDYKVKLKY